jgi:Rrf2 family protein
MKLSARACYGTRALIELAQHWKQGPTLLKDIAQNQKISLPYLARVMSPLIAAGLVRSTRGVHGGIWLARPPHEVKLAEVIQLFEGPVSPRECVTDPDGCPQSDICAARDVWAELGKTIDGLLASITLQYLVEQQAMKERSEEAMYYI